MYSFTSHVRYSEIGESMRMSIPSVIDYLQDCSTFQSESMGIGPGHAIESGLAWLLSDWRIEIARLPRFNDEIRVSTWATAFKGLRAKRNFTICDAGDEAQENPLVRADSAWFMFDSNTGRVARVPASESQPYIDDAADDEPLDMEPVARRIAVADEGEAADPIVVTTSHIDTNHHVNNVQYVSMALGVLGESAPAAPLTLEVHYSYAAKLGDTIYPHVHHEELDGRPATIVTLDTEDGRPYATVRFS